MAIEGGGDYRQRLVQRKLQVKKRKQAGLKNTRADAGPPSSTTPFSSPPERKGPNVTRWASKGVDTKDNKFITYGGKAMAFATPNIPAIIRGVTDPVGTTKGAVELASIASPAANIYRGYNYLKGNGLGITGANSEDIEQAAEIAGIIPYAKAAKGASILGKYSPKIARGLKSAGAEAIDQSRRMGIMSGAGVDEPNEILSAFMAGFEPIAKAADEAIEEVENIPRVLGNVAEIIPTGNRIVNALQLDDATWEAAYNNLQNKTNPTDPNVGAAMLAILNYGPDALRQIDESLVQRLSGIVEAGVVPKFEWATNPSQVEQRVASTMADVSRVFEQPKSTAENLDLTDILRNTLARLGGSNTVSEDYVSPVFSIAKRVADLEDIPLRISAALPKGGIFTFPIDHNPLGLGAVRETGNRGVNEGIITADSAAKAMTDIVKALRGSGIAIPAELNKRLGTDARWSLGLPAWKRAYEDLPNLSDAWIDAGLLDEYASNAKRLVNTSDEVNMFLELYKRYAEDPNWLKIINSR